MVRFRLVFACRACYSPKVPHLAAEGSTAMISETILPEFDEEMQNTRKMLERIPDGNFEFKPHEKSMPLGRLASHIAEFPSWASHTLMSEVLEMQPGEQPYSAKSKQELLEKFDKDVVEARQRIAKTSDEDFRKTWRFIYGGKEIIALPRTSVLRSMVMNHMIHHRAQLGVYLRLNEIEVPGMYGPSADEIKFWAQAAQ
jgi:uncharacterized damage-inducible protein DinB